MTVYKNAEVLQEALDLLNDLEKRRTSILKDVDHVATVVGLKSAEAATVVDAAHEAATMYLFHCMMQFRKAYEDAHDRQSEGS